MTNVILLREPNLDGPDRYEHAFMSVKCNPKSVTVLDTVCDNVETLRDIILDGPRSRKYHGVVITSKRSCDAWEESLALIRGGDLQRGGSDLVMGRGLGLTRDWSGIPFYVVGQTTADAISEVFSRSKDLGFESIDIRGQSSGNAATLGPFILEDLQNVTTENPTLLYLTGDKNRDTISRILTDGGVKLEALQVYTTRTSPSFEADLDKTLETFPTEAEVKKWWIVYFAPSTATFVTPILRKHFYFPSIAPDVNMHHLPEAHVAAIGPTTDSFLREELGLRVHAVAPKPTPEEVVKVVTMYRP